MKNSSSVLDLIIVSLSIAIQNIFFICNLLICYFCSIFYSLFMRGRVWYLGLSVLLVVSFYFVSGCLNYKRDFSIKDVIDNKIYAFLKVNDPEYSDEILKIETLKINVDNEVWTKLKSNYFNYLKTRDELTYVKNNKWEKAKLKISGEEHQIKIKCHGRAPDQHYNGEMMSISIKCSDTSVFHQKRVNLIIYDNLLNKGELLKYLSKEFQLTYQNQDLCMLQLNDEKMQLMFLENRINNDYLNDIGIKNI